MSNRVPADLVALAQPGILAAIPPVARMVSLRLREGSPEARAKAVQVGLQGLAGLDVDKSLVVGLGSDVVAFGGNVAKLRAPPALSGVGVSVPSTPQAMWWWLRGTDRGELVRQQRALEDAVGAGFIVADVADTFIHDGGKDLSGHQDGTENPKDDDAVVAALDNSDDGIAGGSFVAVQRWTHNLRAFMRHDPHTRDLMVGRRAVDDVEIDDAPPSAHVKRTAQESFSPEAFVWRRSMPWADGNGEGLMFVAFGKSFDAFEAQMRRMVGLDDGIVDALFGFTRAVSSSYFFCPPVKDGKLDLRRVQAAG